MAYGTLSASEVISHWYHLYEGLRQSSREFYDLVEEAIQIREIPDLAYERIAVREGSFFSPGREYLRVWRKTYVFDICGAPFGSGFFVSWWLSELPSGCVALFANVPILNVVAWVGARPSTYYRLDTALMFQESVHSAVLSALDEITSGQGMRAPTSHDRKPILREFLRSPI